jgi:hypothetical protein
LARAGTTLTIFSQQWELTQVCGYYCLIIFCKFTNFIAGETSHKWTDLFINGDFEEFDSENRGGKHSSSFYDYFPELEIEAKLFAHKRCAQKSAAFTAIDLAQFIDEKFCETTNTTKGTFTELHVLRFKLLISELSILDPNFPLIRSVASCRLDLRRWGAKFDKNSQRPYFEGHERADVKEHRSHFINYFLDRREYYYTITEGDLPKWTVPTKKNPCILLCKTNYQFETRANCSAICYFISVHDESTFKSGETSYKRWAFGEETPFYSKGRGRSNMVSDFLVAHDSGPFFNLDQNQYEKAVAKYPQVSVIIKSVLS